jgi:ABC-type multidrug transport system ATPase subunit
LKDVSLSIQPNELVAIIGPSGSGKTSLLNVLSGGARPDDGNVFVNSRDLYRELASLKQSIGVVPQDDIIHSELSVYRTLFYIAKLRLSRDISGAEIDRAIAEILDVTGLSAKRDLPVSKLSGGQLKRASVAVELLTKPSLLFLDEPTAGLDPRTERSMMGLFRQIADSGRTVVVTTHAADSVSLFDKVAVLMHGRLVYFGKPDEALRAFNVPDIATLFDRLEAGDGSGTASAESLRESYAASPDFQRYVAEPRSQISATAPTARQKKSRLGLVGSIRQWLTLSRRYFEVLFKDKLNIALILAEAPIVALITLAAVDPRGPRDFIYFILAIVAIWFGTSISAREIVRERPIFKRERRVNLGLFPYVFSKLTVLGFLLAVQCILLFIPLKAADLVSPGTMPGDFFGIPQLWTVILSAAVGLSLGLFISSIVRTGTMAATLVPLVLIPQILLSGIIGVPNSVAKPLSMLVPAAWSFDTIKRFSGLPTLEPEGAEADGPTRGLGLLKQVETDNDAILAKARRDLDEYQKTTVEKLRKYDDDRIAGLTPPRPDLEEMPAIPNARKIPDDLSGYVTFLHPWMNEVLNQVILMLMFGVLIAATFVVLKLRDIR